MFNNSSDPDQLLYVEPLTQPLYSFAIILLLLIILSTTLGNFLVIRAIFTETSLQQVQNFPLVSLAMADLLTAILVMSQGMVYEVLQYWPLSTFLCYFWIVMDVFLCTASILNMCLIGIDRYLAISRPIWYAQVRTPPIAVMGILAAWGFSALVAFPPLFGWINLNFTPVEGYFGQGYKKCDYPQETSYVIYSTMGSFIIPLIVIMITYYHIYQAAKNRIQRRRDSLPKVRASERIRINNIRNSAIASCTDINRKADGETSRKVKRDVESSVRRPSTSELQRKKKVEPTASFSKGDKLELRGLKCNDEHQQSSNSAIHKSDDSKKTDSKNDSKPRTPRSVVEFVVKMEKICVKQERKAALVLLVVVTLFLICWTPFFVMYVYEAFLPPEKAGRKRPEKIYASIVWLGYVNSMMNPLVYSCMNANFRTAFAKILKCNRSQQPNFAPVQNA